MKTHIKQNIFSLAFFGILFLFIHHDSNAQLVSGNGFLQGAYAEVGVSPSGSFGTTVGVPNATYHPRPGSQLGFVSDPQKNGWSTGTPNYIGDYFIPGQPEEGWGMTINNNNYNNMQLMGNFDIPGGLSNYVSTAQEKSITWQGSVSGLSITARTYLPVNSLYFVTEVTVVNTSASTINNVFYMRNVDPDQEQPLTSNYSTSNSIVYQNSNTCNRALVSATGLTYGAYLGLGSIDSRARVSRGSFSNRSASRIWNGTGVSQSGTASGDFAISIAFNLGNLAPNQSTTFSYAYILSAADLNNALAATNINFNINGFSYSTGAAANICSGTATPISIVNPGTFTSWTWSPSTGLNTTTGTNVVSTLTSPITYTATGTGPCGSVQLNITVNPVISPTVGNAGSMTGPSSVLLGQNNVNYSISPVANATQYVWTLPPGAVVTSGANTNSITFNASNISWCGDIVVTPSNNCSTGLSSSKFTCLGNELTCSILSNSFCVGQSLDVTYTSGGIFNTGNVFTAQLSDANGNFGAPVSIGSVTSTAFNGTIPATIPMGTLTGTGYRIRVVSSNLVGVGSTNGSDIAINNYVTPAISLTAASTTICASDDGVFTADLTNGGSSPNITWFLNGQSVAQGSDTSIEIANLATNDEVYAVLNSNVACPTINSVSSNVVVMNVLALPTITCPSNITVSNDTGQCGANVSFAATATGSPTPTLTYSPASGSFFPIGTTTVTATATNSCGAPTCTFTVTVNDTEAPTVSCPANIVKNTNTLLASYPLENSLTDVLGAFGPVTLSGSATAPTTGNPLCLNGIYSFNTNGQDATTPIISSLDTSNFIMKVDFKLSGYPVSGLSFPIVLGGNSFRWFGFYVNSSQQVGIKYNNSNTLFSSKTLNLNQWYTGELVYTANTAILKIDGLVVMNTPLPDLVTGGNLNFTTNDYSNGLAFNGCIRNLEIYNRSNVGCGNVVDYTAPVGNDNCAGSTITQTSGLSSGSVFPVGTTINNFQITDSNNNTSACSFTVTVNDTEAPFLGVPNNVMVNNNTGACGAIVNYTTPVATDICTVTTIQTAGLASGSLFPIGSTVNTFQATDASGNVSINSFTVTVNDTEAPTITCPANITVSNTLGQCGSSVTFAATASDNCGTANLSYSPASGSFFAVGTTTVTATANDSNGNTSSCTFTVTVNDTEAPTITCSADITMNNIVGQCGANVSFVATASDNCGTANVSYSPASGSFFAAGTTTVMATANDGNGNTSSCTFTVTVNDTQPPSITCAAPISVQCPSDVVLTPPTASDNCALGLIYGPEMATEGGFDFGGYYWYQCGNNVEAYGSEAGYGGSNPFNTVAEIDHEPVSLCQSINGFVVGQTYQLTFRASRRSGAPTTVGADIAIDGGALSTTVTRSNTVFDLTLETFTFVATQTTHQLTFVPSSGWSGTVGFIVDDITIKKASTIDNNAPANFPYGNTTVTWTVVDTSGNTATCTQLVSVNDTIAPSITCAPAVVVSNTPGLCTGTTTLKLPTVDDNCSVGNALGFDGGSNYVVSDMDVSETDYTAEMWFKTTNGNCGLFMVSNFNQGYDHDRHIYLSGGDIRVRTWTDETISTSGTNYADGNWHHVAHTLGAGGQKIYVDGILKASGVKSQSDFYWQANIHIGFSWDSPNPYFQGIIDEVRVWNVARTQAEIQANMNNELNTQANLQAVFHFNQGIADGNNAGINTATDASGNGYSGALFNFALNGSISNWTVGKVKNITVTNNAPAAFALGTNTVTWTATDSSGNTAICTQTVTVNDTEAPTIACPSNITVNNTANQCGANVSFTATASDNCGTANVTYSPASGSFFAVGTTTVTATADDGHGNTTSCNFTVTVNDNQPPVINCPGNINVDMNAGVCGATVTFAATASDNCGTANITYSPASGSFFALGTSTVTATADDGHGNTTSCTFTVTVDLLDHVNLQWPPNATICPGGTFTAYGQVYEPNVTTVNGQQGANIEVQFGYNSSNTNPSTWSNWSPASFNQFGGGPNNDEYFYNFSSNVPGTYYYTFRYRQNGCTWQYGGFQQWDGGTWDGTNYVSGVLTVQSLDWANLQWPPNARICQGSSMTAYGQVYETGLTIGAGAQGAGIDVQFGYSTTNTNPSGWSNWSTASFNQFGGGSANDEYYYNFTPPTSGTYYYTFRYRLNGCLWQYGGYTSGGGYFWDGTNSVSGRLIVDPTTVGGAVSGGTSICPGETSALLTLSGYTGDILGWESSVFPFLSWTPIGNNNNTYTSGPLAETTKFRAILQSGVCSSTASADTTVIVYLTYPFYADNDDDGYGAGASVLLCSDDANNAPEGYSVDGTDCDDTLADRHETFPFFVDADGDSYGAEGSTAVQLCAVDGNTPPESNYSVNDDDCNDSVFAINPSVAEIPFDNIDNNCNGTLYDGHPLIVVHVLSPSCGGINHGLNNTINCTEIDLGAGFVIGYRFKVTNLSTGQVDYVDTVQHHFKLTDTDIYAYGTSYSIQVAAIVNGEVQGYNGSTCTLTTTNVATTKVVNSQCGSTLLFMNSTINANSVNSAISYRFRVARADAPTVYYYTGERNLPNFNLTMLTVPVGFLTYDTEYKVDVQIKIKLANIIAWSQFGQVCSIFTPVPPTSAIITSQCELVASSYTQVINATPFAGATVYRFLLTHYDEFGELDYEQYQDSPTPNFTLSMFTGLLPDTTYNVSVAMQLYGTFVPYDKECTVTTPIAARIIETTAFKATVYPNPYTNNFMIEVKTADAALIDIKVYDMVGRLVEQRTVKVSDLEKAPIGERYPSGVYNVIVSQGDNIQTVRVVRR